MRTVASGRLLVLEGIDGSGKDTQLALLSPWVSQHINRLGIPGLVLSKEPGAGVLGAAIRQILLDQEFPLDPLAETLLFLADRAQHMVSVVGPALAAGQLVLLNRHTASTVAYQGYGKGVDLKEIERLNRVATGGIQPDRNYLLDLTAEDALRRFQNREGGPGDRMERTGIEFLRRVREGYLAQARQEPDRWCVLDAALPPQAIQEELRRDVEAILLSRCSRD